MGAEFFAQERASLLSLVERYGLFGQRDGAGEDRFERIGQPASAPSGKTPRRQSG